MNQKKRAPEAGPRRLETPKVLKKEREYLVEPEGRIKAKRRGRKNYRDKRFQEKKTRVLRADSQQINQPRNTWVGNFMKGSFGGGEKRIVKRGGGKKPKGGSTGEKRVSTAQTNLARKGTENLGWKERWIGKGRKKKWLT